MPDGVPAERPQAMVEEPAENDDTGGPLDDHRALQILSTEHWSLLTARSLAYNEAFSRAGTFLTFLSATLIVIGFLVASGDRVLPIVGLLLFVDLFIGVTTIGRLVNASNEEFRALRGMNRIRHAYSEMVPGIERYFVSSIHDDARGVLSNFGGEAPQSEWLGVIHGLTTAIGMLMIVCCVLAAALVSVIAVGIGAALGVAILLGIASFVAAFGVSVVGGRRVAQDVAHRQDALFPTPD